MIDLGFLRGKKIAVMGLAKSGLATATALVRAGARVLAWDDAESGRAAAEAAGVPLTDLHDASLDGVELLVLSPGIPHAFPAPNPVAARAATIGIPIIGDIELLVRAQPEARYVGITGTNGKSTTTALIGHILGLTGRPLAVGGNLGTPVLTFPPLGADGTYVLEMSSYQLELVPSLVFGVAVLLNITPDHLARHGGLDGYIAAKRRIFQGMKGRGTAIVAVDDDHTRAIAADLARAGVAVVEISAEGPCDGVFVIDGILHDLGRWPGRWPGRGPGPGTEIDLTGIPVLPGRHNWQNAAAAYAATLAAGADPAAVLEGLRSFPGLAHRQQLVAGHGGIRFVNDSKATNADAAAKALVCYDDIYWILGGRAKEGGLDGLEPLMPRIRHAFLIGEATEDFAAWLGRQGVPLSRCGTLDRAVAEAAAQARAEALPGACVLLSPACASWDQFASFEQRGTLFADLVRQETVPAGGAA